MQFLVSNIPSSIVSVEELVVWAAIALQPSLSKVQVAESVGSVSGPRVDSNIFTNGEGDLNVVFRLSLPLVAGALISDGFLYKKIQQVTSDPIPPTLVG